MKRFATVHDPLGIAPPLKLPVQMSVEQQLAIAFLVATTAPKMADRLRALQVYREISGEGRVAGSEGLHILEVRLAEQKVEQK